MVRSKRCTAGEPELLIIAIRRVSSALNVFVRIVYIPSLGSSVKTYICLLGWFITSIYRSSSLHLKAFCSKLSTFISYLM